MGAFRFTLARAADRRARASPMAAWRRRRSARRTPKAALVGARLDDRGSWAAARDALKRDFTPITDMRATAAYRAEVAANLLKQALIEVAGGAAPTRLGEVLAAL